MKTYNIKFERRDGKLYANGNLISKINMGKVVSIENGSTGTGHSAHPNIDATGSVRGMKERGYWRKEDKVVRVRGFYYNISHVVISDELDAMAYALQSGFEFFYPAKDWEVLNYEISINGAKVNSVQNRTQAFGQIAK